MKHSDSYLIDDLLMILNKSGFKASRDNLHMVLWKILDDHLYLAKTVDEIKREIA